MISELLDEICSEYIRHQDKWHWVSNNISTSTSAVALWAAFNTKEQQDIDCMICISLFYNKQEATTDRPERISPDSHFFDYCHSDLERPKQLSSYGLYLQSSDQAWHSPLVCRINAHCFKNQRTRSDQSHKKRLAREEEHGYRPSQSSRHTGGGKGYKGIIPMEAIFLWLVWLVD